MSTWRTDKLAFDVKLLSWLLTRQFDLIPLPFSFSRHPVPPHFSQGDFRPNLEQFRSASWQFAAHLIRIKLSAIQLIQNIQVAFFPTSQYHQ